MTVVGINFAVNQHGERTSTLHVVDDFEAFYNNEETGRSCIGQKCETIYVGTTDVSNIEVGSIIDVFYDKAVQTKNGLYQPVKSIKVLD